MTTNEPLPQRQPGATFAAAKPAATTLPPQTPDGWSDPWTRPAAHTTFGAPKDDQ
jgi:hypothetical protein